MLKEDKIIHWKQNHHDANFVVTGGSVTSDNEVGIMTTYVFQ